MLDFKIVKCPHCGYEWRCTSTAVYVSCPKCVGRVRLIPKRQPILNAKPTYNQLTHPDPYQVIVKENTQ